MTRGSESPFFFFYHHLLLLLLSSSLLISFLFQVTSYDGHLYDSSAYTECKAFPENPLYDGGILGDQQTASYVDFSKAEVKKLKLDVEDGALKSGSSSYTRAILLRNLSQAIYTFSAWVSIKDGDESTALVRATLNTEGETYDCIGSVQAKRGCWSFLKGGFVLNTHSNSSLLYFQNFDVKNVNIEIASASLQPFTDEEWKWNQQDKIIKERKRFATIHVSGVRGERLQGASVSVEQISNEFPFGSAIADTIVGNQPYQEWFLKRFNAAVFENELKWYATEAEKGKTNYTRADQMMDFVKSNTQITSVRGHNIFWEDPSYTPKWVLNLTGSDLSSAVTGRIQGLMDRYRGDFVHWDVSNELLHFDFYENRLGPNATLRFFTEAHRADPLATLFLNEFNVVETCGDGRSSVDNYVAKVKELRNGGVYMNGIGLEGHFGVPNLPLIRGILDKLGTLGLPVWLTEVDISHTIDKELQAVYLEQVLREGFSHPSIEGIMLWTALHPNGCYQMCLTDTNMQNLPAGNVVDKLLLQEWKTGQVKGQTDQLGTFDFHGFLGEYQVTVEYQGRRANSTISLDRGDETKHFNIRLL